MADLDVALQAQRDDDLARLLRHAEVVDGCEAIEDAVAMLRTMPLITTATISGSPYMVEGEPNPLHHHAIPAPQHEVTGTICQGGVEHAVECLCGWQSSFTRREAEARAEHAQHVEAVTRG